MSNNSNIEIILKKDRLIVAAGLFIICIISWAYIIYLYEQMYPMDMDAFLFAMPMSASWTLVDFSLLFLMWFVMMIAMMTPSVSPLVLIFAMMNRKRAENRKPYVSTAWLFGGYFLVWAIFSLLATALQWLLQYLALMNADMVSTNRIFSGVTLIVAGIFQFTDLKQRCLYHCRTPIDFLHLNWKEGKTGALRMGIENGIYCLGCCWVLMILLFVAGVMNLLWIALIAFFVLLEKMLPGAKWISFIAGAGLVLYGFIVLDI